MTERHKDLRVHHEHYLSGKIWSDITVVPKSAEILYIQDLEVSSVEIMQDVSHLCMDIYSNDSSCEILFLEIID